jgi:hypothetical protein
VRLRPTISSQDALDQWAGTVLRRSATAVRVIWGALYLLHLAVWLLQFEIEPTLAHVAPFLLALPFLSRKGSESLAWVGGGGALAASLGAPPTVAPTALAVAVMLAWQARLTRRSGLWVGAVLSSYVALLTVGWETWPAPQPAVWLGLGTAAVLLVIAVHLRLPSAVVAALLVLAPHARQLTPRTRLELGITLLAAGFIALVLGVAVNWNARRATW